MRESTERVKIQRTRKRIYEMDHEEAPELIAANLNLSENTPDFLPPFQGEIRGGDGVDSAISVEYQDHPHTFLPLEGEGTKSSLLEPVVQEPGVILQESVAQLVTSAAEVTAPGNETTAELPADDTAAVAEPVRLLSQDREKTDRHEEIYRILRESEPDSEYTKEHVGVHNQNPETGNKDDLFQSAMSIVYRYSAVSAATGLIPIPLVDMAGFMATQLLMLKKLCNLYNISFDSQRSKSAIAILASGINSAYLAASSSKLIPFIGVFTMAAMPAVNGALSYAVGRVFIQHFESGGTFLDFDPHKVRGYFEEQFRAGKVSRSGEVK